MYALPTAYQINHTRFTANIPSIWYPFSDYPVCFYAREFNYIRPHPQYINMPGGTAVIHVLRLADPCSLKSLTRVGQCYTDSHPELAPQLPVCLSRHTCSFNHTTARRVSTYRTVSNTVISIQSFRPAITQAEAWH